MRGWPNGPGALSVAVLILASTMASGSGAPAVTRYEGPGSYGWVEGPPDLLALTTCFVEYPDYPRRIVGDVNVVATAAEGEIVAEWTFQSASGPCTVARSCLGSGGPEGWAGDCVGAGAVFGSFGLRPNADGTFAFTAHLSRAWSVEGVEATLRPVGP